MQHPISMFLFPCMVVGGCYLYFVHHPPMLIIIIYQRYTVYGKLDFIGELFKTLQFRNIMELSTQNYQNMINNQNFIYLKLATRKQQSSIYICLISMCPWNYRKNCNSTIFLISLITFTVSSPKKREKLFVLIILFKLYLEALLVHIAFHQPSKILCVYVLIWR